MAYLLGEKLRFLRLERNLTLTDLARQVNSFRRAHIGNVETNQRPPSLLFILRMASLFGVTTDYLVRDSIPLADVDSHRTSRPTEQVGLPQQFGVKLRRLREEHHLSQSELARRLGLIAHAHISLLESGRHAPSIDLVVLLADCFGVTTDYLLWDDIVV